LPEKCNRNSLRQTAAENNPTATSSVTLVSFVLVEPDLPGWKTSAAAPCTGVPPLSQVCRSRYSKPQTSDNVSASRSRSTGLSESTIARGNLRAKKLDSVVTATPPVRRVERSVVPCHHFGPCIGLEWSGRSQRENSGH